MTVWCHLPTIFNRRHVLRTAGLIALCVALTTTLMLSVVSRAAPGVNKTLSFQGRLLNASGGVVADGHYNIQFKIYQDGSGTSAGNPGGSLKWTETYINNGSNSGVEVINGYFSVTLGSVNTFGTSVDWNQDTLWLSMNVAGSSASCTTFNSGTCVADGEMTPMKRITSTPYAINSGQLGGKTADNFVQLSQGVQEDAANNSNSIYINKTGTDGNFLQLQNAGTDAFTINKQGSVTLGASESPQTIQVATAATDENGTHLGITAGAGGSGSGSGGGSLILQGGSGGGTNGDGGSIHVDGGNKTGSGTGGSVFIGQNYASNISIGGAQSQSIQIGTTAAGTTDVTIGATNSAAGGKTTIQSKDETTIKTNGTSRATFAANSNTLYLGNANGSGQASTANSFTIQGTSSTGNNVQGGSLSLVAGSATNGNANGGNLVLSGGAGVGTGAEGLIVLDSPTAFQAASVQTCSSNCTVTQANVDGNGVIIVNASQPSVTISLNAPTNTTAGRIVYVMAANGSNDFTLSVNGGGAGNLTSMRQNTTATMVWSGSAWTVAGASNSTTLQSAYNNTLQSAGGAELIVSSGTNANGLTIRDSSTNPVNGTLLEVQNASASTLFSVNSNVPEYASNGGAENADTHSTNWAAHGTSTVSRFTTAGPYVATGQASTQVAATAASSGVRNTLSKQLTPNMQYNVSFGVRLNSGSFTDLAVRYASNGSTPTATCKTGVIAATSSWTKVNCSFTTPSSGLTTSNTIIIEQVGSANRTFYIDNLSVTIAGNQNYATDGNVNDNTNFTTNWTSAGAGTVTVTRNTTDGKESSDSAQAQITTGADNAGVRNKLSIAPLPSTLYRMSTYVKVGAEPFTDFKIRYSRDGGTTFTDCVDYNTQTISASVWTEVTCYITTDSTEATNPYAYFVETSSATRTFMVDAFEMNLATNTAANVQIGGGASGGQTTLFTLDQGAAAPISDNNDALLGSMYYDTTLGKIQCYEADGWGACGSSPDNIITISPEYTNAVMRGSGVGTMTSDFCSDTLNINDGSGAEPAVCGTGQTYNFYKWTSPQATSQTYSIYVTYQLPGTFKSFASGSTSIKARTDSGSNGGSASVQYTVMKNNGTSLTACGSAVTVSTGTQTAWQPGKATGTADPSTCGFAPGDSIVFKIDVSASKNAIAYLSDLGFTFSNN